MKKIYKIFICILCLLTITGCRDKIDIDNLKYGEEISSESKITLSSDNLNKFLHINFTHSEDSNEEYITGLNFNVDLLDMIYIHILMLKLYVNTHIST